MLVFHRLVSISQAAEYAIPCLLALLCFGMEDSGPKKETQVWWFGVSSTYPLLFSVSALPLSRILPPQCV